jgi:hypothetical protein
MRRLTAWLAGLAGALAAYRIVRRRPAPAPPPEGPDPAAELKAKLAQARAAASDRDAFESGETPVDQAADPDIRRRSVHEQARAAIDEMRGE